MHTSSGAGAPVMGGELTPTFLYKEDGYGTDLQVLAGELQRGMVSTLTRGTESAIGTSWRGFGTGGWKSRGTMRIGMVE